MRDTKSRLRVLIVGAAVVGTLLTGCGGASDVGSHQVVAKAKLQAMVKEELQAAAGRKVKKVECQDDIAGEVGATQRCELTANDGSRIGLTATVKAVEGEGRDANVNIDVKVDDKPVG
ncbi:DUF4333 domain-containing protein [Mycolicibacterium sp. XJ870]